MQLALKTIADARRERRQQGRHRQGAVFATTATPSVLGTFGFDQERRHDA